MPSPRKVHPEREGEEMIAERQEDGNVKKQVRMRRDSLSMVGLEKMDLPREKEVQVAERKVVKVDDEIKLTGPQGATPRESSEYKGALRTTPQFVETPAPEVEASRQKPRTLTTLYIDTGRLITERPDGQCTVVNIQAERLVEEAEQMVSEQEGDDGGSFLSPIPVMCPRVTKDLRFVSDIQVVHSPVGDGEALTFPKRTSLVIKENILERRSSIDYSAARRGSIDSSSRKSSLTGSFHLLPEQSAGMDGGVVQVTSLPPVMVPKLPSSGSVNYGNGSAESYKASNSADRKRSIIFPDEKGQEMANVVESSETHYSIARNGFCPKCSKCPRKVLLALLPLLLLILLIVLVSM